MDQQMNMDAGNKSKVCRCPHHKVVPIALMIVGLAFIASAFNLVSISALIIAIGVLLIIKGGIKLMGASCKCWETHSK